MPKTINRNQLFPASCITLIFTFLKFPFLASLEAVRRAEFNSTKKQSSWIFAGVSGVSYLANGLEQQISVGKL